MSSSDAGNIPIESGATTVESTPSTLVSLQSIANDMATGKGESLLSTPSGGSDTKAGFTKFFTKISEWIMTFLRLVTGGINRHLGKVLAFFVLLFLFFIIIFVGFSGFRRISAKLGTGRGAAYKESGSSNVPWYKLLWKELQSTSTPIGGKAYGGLPRQAEPKGRCDNIEWLTVQNKQSAVCLNTGFRPPQPARFTLNPSSFYEYDILPYKIKEKIRTSDGKLSVIVPYMYHEKPSSYVLDFSKAKFQDGTSAKHLFNKTFRYDSWNFASKKLPKYKPRRRYLSTHKKYRGLDKYLK